MREISQFDSNRHVAFVGDAQGILRIDNHDDWQSMMVVADDLHFDHACQHCPTFPASPNRDGTVSTSMYVLNERGRPIAAITLYLQTIRA